MRERKRTQGGSERNSERKRLRILPETFISQSVFFFSPIINACFIIIESCALEILIRAAGKETAAKRLFWPSDHVKSCEMISPLFTSTLVYFICSTISISFCLTSHNSCFSIFLLLYSNHKTTANCLPYLNSFFEPLQQFSAGFASGPRLYCEHQGNSTLYQNKKLKCINIFIY